MMATHKQRSTRKLKVGGIVRRQGTDCLLLGKSLLCEDHRFKSWFNSLKKRLSLLRAMNPG